MDAVNVELAHGVASAQDGVAEPAKGVVIGTLPDESRAVLVYACRVAVVRADHMAEEGAGGFVHELSALGSHVVHSR